MILWFGLAGALSYAAAASLLNRTLLERAGADIIVSHRPLPFPGKHLRAADVREVLVDLNPGPLHSTDEAVSWELTAVLRDGRKVQLTWGPMAGHRRELLEKAACHLNAALR